MILADKVRRCSGVTAFFCVVFTLLFVFSPLKLSAQSMNEQEFKAMLAKVLRENPDLVMSVLRAHSSEVLSIAQQGGFEKRKTDLLEQWKKDARQNKKINAANRPIKGSANAPVLITAFSDFTCPYCAKAALTIDQALLNNPAKLRFVFKHRPLEAHPNSELASRYFIAASLQSDAKAWELYKKFFNNREKIMGSGEDFLAEQARQVNLDVGQLQKDLNSSQVNKILSEDREEAKRFGFDGTPYIMVNNLVIAGAPSEEVLNLAIDEAYSLKR